MNGRGNPFPLLAAQGEETDIAGQVGKLSDSSPQREGAQESRRRKDVFKDTIETKRLNK